ncbi:MAG: peptidoglycan DD-metalloendopeptidase family protein [Chloroflexota bacterium]
MNILSKLSNLLLIHFFILCLLLPPSATSLALELSQANSTDRIYTVQSGDSLMLIALAYDLSPAAILLANQRVQAPLLLPGQQIVLPGVAPDPTPAIEASSNDPVHIVQPGENLYTIANNYGVTVGAVVLANALPNPDNLDIGQTLRIPVGPLPTPGPIAAPFEAIELSKPFIVQGQTLVVNVTLSEQATVSGTFEGYPLFFNTSANGQQWSIIGIHALAEPKAYPITLTATRPDGSQVMTFVNVTVTEGPYGTENIRVDGSRGELLTTELIQTEQQRLTEVWKQITLRPQWEGPFQYPVGPDNLQVTSSFGTRRSYNDGPATSFHGGTDFGGGTGAPIYAPADGIVALAETLTVRGNAVLIDHGLGLFSGYWHQSQIIVEEGQTVEAGQLIGYIGNTGLVTGPHLHWELRLNGIAVDPIQWIEESIP